MTQRWVETVTAMKTIKHKSNRKMLTGTWLSSQKVKQWGLKFRPCPHFDAFIPSVNTKQYAECYNRKCIDLKTLLIEDENENAQISY